MTRVRDPDPVGQSIAAITTIAAAVLLLTVAVLSILEGVAAVAGDEIFTIVPRYTYDLDVATWGWVHIVLGVLLAVVGIALMAGTTWARVTAAVFAALSILANFLWLPYYPWWSIVIIVLNVLVIWAVTTWQPDLM